MAACLAPTHLGPELAPLLCGKDADHDGAHSWHTLPCLSHVTVMLGGIAVSLAEVVEACNRPPCPIERDETV